MRLELDQWQKDVRSTEGLKNLCICSGRQVGKSTVVSMVSADFAAKNPKRTVLIVSVTEKQAEEMLIKVLLHISEEYRALLKKGKDRPTKHTIKLTNGSVIRCEPIGQTGIGVLGFTVDLIVADEAAFMPEAVWNVLTPMLLTTGGHIILVSTPNAKEGYFWDAWSKPELGFMPFYISSEEVAEKRKEPQRTYMKDLMENDKKRMSKFEYARWYLAKFQDELRRLFSDEIIASSMTESPGFLISPGEYSLGVDVARYGGDETTFEVLKKLHRGLHPFEHLFLTQTSITFTTRKIEELNRKYDFRKIYIDTGGLGVGVFDNLLEIDEVKRKIVDMNNAKRSIEYSSDGPRLRRLLKEDMYQNLLRLMETRKIHLLKEDSIALSLRSVLIETDEETKKTRIFGSYTHIAEGLIRAAWFAKEKNIRIWIDSI